MSDDCFSPLNDLQESCQDSHLDVDSRDHKGFV